MELAERMVSVLSIPTVLWIGLCLGLGSAVVFSDWGLGLRSVCGFGFWEWAWAWALAWFWGRGGEGEYGGRGGVEGAVAGAARTSGAHDHPVDQESKFNPKMGSGMESEEQQEQKQKRLGKDENEVGGDEVEPQDPFTDEFKTLAQRTLDEWHLPGLAIAVVDGGGTFFHVRIFNNFSSPRPLPPP